MGGRRNIRSEEPCPDGNQRARAQRKQHAEGGRRGFSPATEKPLRSSHLAAAGRSRAEGAGCPPFASLCAKGGMERFQEPCIGHGFSRAIKIRSEEPVPSAAEGSDPAAAGRRAAEGAGCPILRAPLREGCRWKDSKSPVSGHGFSRAIKPLRSSDLAAAEPALSEVEGPESSRRRSDAAFPRVAASCNRGIVPTQTFCARLAQTRRSTIIATP